MALDLAKLLGHPSSLHTGRCLVGVRHPLEDGTWPAVIVVGQATLYDENFRVARVRLELTADEATELALQLLQFASRLA